MRAASPALTPARQAYYDRIDGDSLAALWTVLKALVPAEPQDACRPHHWSFARIRALMIEAGDLITAEEAERRVLILENPGLRGQARTTGSLYAGVQMVLPGEVAPAHRHSQSALRFALEGAGAYTTVEGERCFMHPGDLVLTPAMTWHDHGNPSDAPMFWLDGLDIPIVRMLGATFGEGHGQATLAPTRPSGDSEARFGHNLLPIDHVRGGEASPIMAYPYARTREALDRLKAHAQWDPCHGLKLRYANPLTGGDILPTIGAFIQLLPRGFATRSYRSTDASVLCIVEGKGQTRIGDTLHQWEPHDILVVPAWQPVVHEVARESVIFAFSDRPVQQKLGLFREQRGTIERDDLDDL